MNTAPISVVIPAHNAARFIGEAIDTVQSQTLPVSEVIVVANDCSDETAEIAKRRGAIVVPEKIRNLSVARNTGIRATQHEWIAFIDADDLWVEDKTELQWNAIQACPEIGMVASDYFYLRGKVATNRTRKGLKKIWDDYDDKRRVNRSCVYLPRAHANLFSRFFPFCSSIIMRREAFDTIGPFDEALIYSQDFEFFLRLVAKYPLAVIEKPLFYYRIHDGNMSKDARGKWQAHISIVNMILKNPDRYPAGAADYYRDSLKSSFHGTERLLARHLKPDGTYSLETN